MRQGTKLPGMYDRGPAEQKSGGRKQSTRGLPQHIADIAVAGRRLGDMGNAEIARLCQLLEIPGTGHEASKSANAEALIERLNEIGRFAAEREIAEWIAVKIGATAQ